MQKFFLTILTIIFTFSFCFSQDIITKKTGKKLKAKIVEVTPSIIKYKKYHYQKGPTKIISKAEVSTIHYQNGSQEIFDDSQNNDTTSLSNASNENLFILGQKDAFKYYKGYKGASTSTLIIGLISPIVGLIPAIACSSTPPRKFNLNYPNRELMKNADYYDGYALKAKKIKQKKIWTNLGIAFGVNFLAALVLYH